MSLDQHVSKIARHSSNVEQLKAQIAVLQKKCDSEMALLQEAARGILVSVPQSDEPPPEKSKSYKQAIEAPASQQCQVMNQLQLAVGFLDDTVERFRLLIPMNPFVPASSVPQLVDIFLSQLQYVLTLNIQRYFQHNLTMNQDPSQGYLLVKWRVLVTDQVTDNDFQQMMDYIVNYLHNQTCASYFVQDLGAKNSPYLIDTAGNSQLYCPQIQYSKRTNLVATDVDRDDLPEAFSLDKLIRQLEEKGHDTKVYETAQVKQVTLAWPIASPFISHLMSDNFWGSEDFKGKRAKTLQSFKRYFYTNGAHTYEAVNKSKLPKYRVIPFMMTIQPPSQEEAPQQTVAQPPQQTVAQPPVAQPPQSDRVEPPAKKQDCRSEDNSVSKKKAPNLKTTSWADLTDSSDDEVEQSKN